MNEPTSPDGGTEIQLIPVVVLLDEETHLRLQPRVHRLASMIDTAGRARVEGWTDMLGWGQLLATLSEPPEPPRASADGDNTFAGCESPQEVLQMLVGAASVCWGNADLATAGVFQSELALRYANDALERLIELGWA